VGKIYQGEYVLHSIKAKRILSFSLEYEKQQIKMLRLMIKMDEGSSNNISTSTVDMEQWISILEANRRYYVSLTQTDSSIRHFVISKVPQMIFELDRNAYEPFYLSIGPYHHGNPALQVLEKKKWNYLNYILRLNSDKTLKDYLQLMEGLEKQARNCYPQEVSMESDEFIKMLLLDGCFLLVALFGIQGTELQAIGATELSSEPEINIEDFEDTETRPITGEQLLEVPESSTKTMSTVEVKRHNKFTDHSRENSITALQMSHKEGCDKSGPIDVWLTNFLLHDLLLLENQIPFFVVRAIYELYTGELESSKPADNIGEFLVNIEGYSMPFPGTCMPNNFHHLLHFWHLYLRPTEDRVKPEDHHRKSLLFQSFFIRSYEKLNIGSASDKTKMCKHIQTSRFLQDGPHLIRWRRAEQYHEAGVHFQKRVFTEKDRHSLLDIRFTNGSIEIPPLIIASHTASFFKNIIALEQTFPQYGNYFTSYSTFMTQLVTKPADVTLLASRGILTHHMRSDEEVSSLLAKLGNNVNFDISGSHYLKSICIRMEEHYQSRITTPQHHN